VILAIYDPCDSSLVERHEPPSRVHGDLFDVLPLNFRDQSPWQRLKSGDFENLRLDYKDAIKKSGGDDLLARDLVITSGPYTEPRAGSIQWPATATRSRLCSASCDHESAAIGINFQILTRCRPRAAHRKRTPSGNVSRTPYFKRPCDCMAASFRGHRMVLGSSACRGRNFIEISLNLMIFRLHARSISGRSCQKPAKPTLGSKASSINFKSLYRCPWHESAEGAATGFSGARALFEPISIAR
jgi:hypothetical protein